MMKPHRKKKLQFILIGLAGLGVAMGLILYSLSQNINLYFSPSQVAADEAPIGATIRVGGLVKVGSIERTDESLEVKFVVSDNANEVTIKYEGILPDLFREGQGIIALGALNADKQFVAQEVLAKHDEEYMPPEVADSLKQVHPDGLPKKM